MRRPDAFRTTAYARSAAGVTSPQVGTRLTEGESRVAGEPAARPRRLRAVEQRQQLVAERQQRRAAHGAHGQPVEPHRAHDAVERDRVRQLADVTSSAAIEASVSGRRSWATVPRARRRVERHLAAERAHARAHRVHADAAAGHVGRRRARSRSRARTAARRRRPRRARRRPPRRAARARWRRGRPRRGRSRGRRRARRRSTWPPAWRAESSSTPVCGLPGGGALGGRLEPVVERVAHEVDERVAERVDDGAVELRVGALHAQLDLLAEPRREVAHEPREAQEDRLDGDHAHTRDRLLQRLRGAREALDRLREAGHVRVRQ